MLIFLLWPFPCLFLSWRSWRTWRFDRLLILSFHGLAWLWHGIHAVGVGRQRGGRIHRQRVDIRRELVIVLQELVARDDLPGVRRHPAQNGLQAGLGAASGFIVRLV